MAAALTFDASVLGVVGCGVGVRGWWCPGRGWSPDPAELAAVMTGMRVDTASVDSDGVVVVGSAVPGVGGVGCTVIAGGRLARRGWWRG